MYVLKYAVFHNLHAHMKSKSKNYKTTIIFQKAKQFYKYKSPYIERIEDSYSIHNDFFSEMKFN